MKPSVKVRYLAALAPLTLGVVLGGCSGFLGSVNGTGNVAAPVAPTGTTVPPPTALSVARSFTISGGTATRSRALGAGATAQLVFRTAGSDIPVPILNPNVTPSSPTNTVTSVPVNADGTYTMSVDLTAGNGAAALGSTNLASGVFVVVITGIDTNTGNFVALAAAVQPPTSAGATITTPVSPSTTLAAVAVSQIAKQPGFVATTDLATQIANANTFVTSHVSSTDAANAVQNVTTSNPLSALADLQTNAQTPLATAVNAAVATIKLTVNGVDVSSTGLSLLSGESRNLTAVALDSAGNVVSIPFVFSTSDSSVVDLRPTNGTAYVAMVKPGIVTVTVHPVGSTKSVSVTITISAHVQGHGQGGGGGL